MAAAQWPLQLRALTNEEKKREFMKARDAADATPTPRRKPTPSPTPKSKASPTPQHKSKTAASERTEKNTSGKRKGTSSETGRRTPRKPAEPEETPTPRPTPRPTPAPDESRDEPRRKPFVSETPTPEPQPTPAPTPVPTPPPKPAPTAAPAAAAPVTIEKSGFEASGGYEPPAPKPARRHWWNFFGGGDSRQYRYLTRELRDAIDRAPVQRRRWRYIVVHNSGTRQGNAKIFDYYHLHTRKMPNGLAYHFVIGNGSSSGNGQIEIGRRWTRQINGGHVHSDYLNNISLGICLVGDFNRDTPSEQQKAALEELISYLRQRVGKIDRKVAIVKAHREINPPQWPTDCPGDRFPYAWFHRKFD